MKLIFMICSLLLILGCKKEPFSGKYNDSLNAWKKFKTESNNSYTYTQTWSSWTGFYSTMKVTVQNGQIIARSYKTIGPEPQDRTKMKTYSEWTEDRSSLNSHTEMAASLTLDEVYQQAKKTWLNVNKNENQIYFETDNNGMISTCGYVPKNCADDCFIGISIKEINKL